MQPTPAHLRSVPSAWVRRFLPLLPAGGRVLDLAAGAGRHVGLLREAGYHVIAVDRETTALKDAYGSDSGCEIKELDLEEGAPWRLGGGYGGIVVANYLHRPLLPLLATSLAPGGALIYETFMLGNERLGKPSSPAFLLRPGELLAAFGDRLSVIAFEQGQVAAPRPAMVQRIAAVNGPVGVLPA